MSEYDGVVMFELCSTRSIALGISIYIYIYRRRQGIGISVVKIKGRALYGISHRCPSLTRSCRRTCSHRDTILKQYQLELGFFFYFLIIEFSRVRVLFSYKITCTQRFECFLKAMHIYLLIKYLGEIFLVKFWRLFGIGTAP